MTEQIFNLDNTDVKCGEGTPQISSITKTKSPLPPCICMNELVRLCQAGLGLLLPSFEAAALHLLSSSQILAPAASPGSSCSQKQQLGSSPELAWEPPNSDM